MRFLIDDALSPAVAALLRAGGSDAAHRRDRGMRQAPDPIVLRLARDEGRVLVSADTDFSEILAVTGASGPSFLQFRKGAPRRADQVALLVLDAARRYADALELGAIVTVQHGRFRVRRLPIGG